MHLDIEKCPLAKGSHHTDSGEACVMELVSCLAGESWSDSPKCVSPVIGAFMRRYNDSVDDAERQKLKRFIPLAMNTATGAKDDDTRSWMAMDWIIREYTPTWLSLAGLDDQAAALRAASEVVDGESLAALMPALLIAREKSAAAWAAARDAAWAAAWDAAWDAAWAAARDAARDAAWAAAWDAARAAAWAAAWDAARDAAWDAAAEKLRPTADTLRVSALALLERMCSVGRR